MFMRPRNISKFRAVPTLQNGLKTKAMTLNASLWEALVLEAMDRVTAAIENCIMEILGREQIRCTPVDLWRLVQNRMSGVRRAEVHKAISRLVGSGRLIYSQHFSTTHLESGVNNPIPVSQRIVLCRPDQRCLPAIGKHCVRIASGGAFGGGEHPTTRLVLQGLDWTVARVEQGRSVSKMMALDIGFGSGVLAIAAVVLGMGQAVGVDIDPMACHEACSNLEINGVEDRVVLLQGTLEKLAGRYFDIVLANLRPPTLVSQFTQMETMTATGGYWVLSGFRPNELEIIERRLPECMHPLWRAEERKWAVLVAKAAK